MTAHTAKGAMKAGRDLSIPGEWQVPEFAWCDLAGSGRSSAYCILVPVIDEGDRVINQLMEMRETANGLDIILADGGSTDGSTEPSRLRSLGVRSLLVKSGHGRLSAQLRMGFAFAIMRGYGGIITIDGNGKDGHEALASFAAALRAGYAFVQGSRYLPGGRAENTPIDRSLAVRLVHAPLLSLAAGFRYTDTTNGFRAFSAELLKDPRVAPFRDVFDTYNLHYYLSVRAPQLEYRVCELPVRRSYPRTGKTVSKIHGPGARLHILGQLLRAVLGAYDPPGCREQ